MIKLTQLFKKCALGTCLLVLLLSPLQSFAQQRADLLVEDIAILRKQVDLIKEGIITSPSITVEKKAELQLVLEEINDIIDGLALQVAANPLAESQRRENVESIKTVGNLLDYTAEIEIVMGPEEVAGVSYDRSTTTYNYNFLTTLTQQQKVERMRELIDLTFAQLAAETGIGQYQIKASSTTSIKRFANEWDARNNYVQPAVSKGLEQFFGQYSIIDDVVITIGLDEFSIALGTDQEETVTMTVAQKFRNCFFGEVPVKRSQSSNNPEFTLELCRDVGKLTYGITYAIYDNIRSSVDVSDADLDTIKEQLAEGLKGVGELFGQDDDKVVTDELLEVMTKHPTYYITENGANITGFEPPATCIQPRIQIILGKIIHHYISAFQVSESPGIVRVKNVVKQPITGSMGVASQSDGCRDVNNSFFPSITLATSTPPVFVNVRSAGGTTNIRENAILTEIKPIGNERDESMYGG